MTRMSRRSFLGCVCCGAASLALGCLSVPSFTSPAVAAGPKTNLTADQVLKLLKDGNDQYLTDAPFRRESTDKQRRIEIARGQAPLAVLVSCSDSRVPPELLFGRGLGELFIVRNAGNTIDTTAMGSLQYAVAELGVPLVLVLGHERCGAVDAAVSVVEKGAMFPGSIGQMIEPIIPAVITAKTKPGDDLLDKSVRENVRRTVARLRTASDPLLLDPIKAGELRIVGARYDLDDGDVDFFDEG